MVGLIVGIVLILTGSYGVLGAQPFVHAAARLWPREMRSGGVANQAAANFVIRFISLMGVAAGVALVARYLV